MFNMQPLDDQDDSNQNPMGWRFVLGSLMVVGGFMTGVVFTGISFFDDPGFWRWSSFSWCVAFFGFVLSLFYSGDDDLVF
jgi:hypothetical protein